MTPGYRELPRKRGRHWSRLRSQAFPYLMEKRGPARKNNPPPLAVSATVVREDLLGVPPCVTTSRLRPQKCLIDVRALSRRCRFYHGAMYFIAFILRKASSNLYGDSDGLFIKHEISSNIAALYTRDLVVCGEGARAVNLPKQI